MGWGKCAGKVAGEGGEGQGAGRKGGRWQVAGTMQVQCKLQPCPNFPSKENETKNQSGVCAKSQPKQSVRQPCAGIACVKLSVPQCKR